MKKIYLLLMAVALGTAVNAQEDLIISLDNYTDGQATSADPLDLSFGMRNNSGFTIPMGDTVYFAIQIGAQVYTVDNLTPGFVTGTILGADWLDGTDLSVTAAVMSMSWIETQLGAKTGDVCAVIVGVGSASLSSVTDVAPLDNVNCVDYTSFLAVDDLDLSQISAYPNPATNVINFNLGTNNVDQIQIIDISGRVIENISVNSSIESLDVSAYGNGVYFFQILKSDEVLTTEKFVVSK